MKILYSDDNIIVCVKPVGLNSEHDVPTELGGEIYTLHRLDKNVGGVMVYARNKKSAAALSAAIQRGEMVKEYVAQTHGEPPLDGDWEDLLFKDSRQNKVFVVKRPRKGVKPARLEFRRLTPGPDALVRVRLHTGRSHQIRVQFSSRGYPLLGDHKYGAKDEFPAPRLFSCYLQFALFGKEYSFESLPEWANISITPQLN